MFKPDVICFDYETALLDGTPSVEYYRPDFRVTTASFSWIRDNGTINNQFLVGESNIRPFLQHIADEGIPLVCHNMTFEYGVSLCRFPDINLNIKYDTMRLVQVADNGGKDMEWTADMSIDDELDALEGKKVKRESGLKLVKCVSRWLPVEYHNHKEPFHLYLREKHGVKKGTEGANLNLLPAEMLRDYNIRDSDVTLLLYLRVVNEFKAIGYDWSMDHWLYASTCRHVAKAKIRGVHVDRERLTKYRDAIVAEIAAIDSEFSAKFQTEINEIEQERLTKYVAKRTTEKGQLSAWMHATLEDQSTYKFNSGSGKQLATLFVDKLKMPVTFWTQEPRKKPGVERKKVFVPSPSFKSTHLHTWGEGGLILENRKRRLLVLQQCNSLLELSAYDGKWHTDLKVCGTATGRAAGGGQ